MEKPLPPSAELERHEATVQCGREWVIGYLGRQLARESEAFLREEGRE